MGFWTHGRDYEKCVFPKPLPQTKSAKKGARKNSPAFCHGRAESIPAAFYPAASPQRGLTIYLSKKGKREYLSCRVSPPGANNYLSKKGERENARIFCRGRAARVRKANKRSSRIRTVGLLVGHLANKPVRHPATAAAVASRSPKR